MGERNVFHNLRSSEFFVKKPFIGVMMFFVGALIFSVLAYSLVNNGFFIKWDKPIAEFFHALALKSSSLVVGIMIAGYYIGWWGIFLVAIIFAIYFFHKKFWRELVLVVASLGLSGLVFLLLSNIFSRPRPFLLFNEMIWPGSPNIPGFPSGHVLSTVVCLSFLAYFLLPRINSSSRKFLFLFFSLLIALYIGFSRLYVGDHYFTDIIAGYAVGFSWFGLSFTIVELSFKKYYGKRKEKRGDYLKLKNGY